MALIRDYIVVTEDGNKHAIAAEGPHSALEYFYARDLDGEQPMPIGVFEAGNTYIGSLTEPFFGASPRLQSGDSRSRLSVRGADRVCRRRGLS